MKLWIRVDADTPRDPLWDTLGTKVGHPAASVLGHALMVWCAMAEHVPTGDLKDVQDTTIERWAGWDGEAGIFAKAFRELCTQDGVVYAFVDRQVKLAEQREKERVRKQRQRDKRQNVPRDVPPPVPKLSHHNGTERNGTKEVKASRPQKQTWLTPAMQAWEAKFGAKSFPFGPAAKHLAPLLEVLTAEEIGVRLGRYLAQPDDPKWLTLAKFAQTHGQYAEDRKSPQDAEFEAIAREASPDAYANASAVRAYQATRTPTEGGSGLGTPLHLADGASSGEAA